MSKVLSVLSILVCLLPCAASAKWSDVKTKGTIRMATEGAFAPFNFYEGKKLTGFEVELGDLLAKEMKLKNTWMTLPFESLLIGLAQSRFDMVIASHGITPARAKSVDFANPHYCTGGIILTREGGPLKLSELAGKKLGVQVGSSYYEQLKKLAADMKPAPQIQTFPKDTDSLSALMLKRIDAMVTDRFVAASASKKHKDKGLKMGEIIFLERVAMAAPKGDSEIISALNTALDTLLKNGSYKKLSMKYFDEDVRCPVDQH